MNNERLLLEWLLSAEDIEFIVPLWEKNPALVVRCFNIFF